MLDNEAGSLLIRIRATAEGLEAVAEEAKGRFQAIGQAAEQTRKPMAAAGKAGKTAGKDMAVGAKEAQLAWLALSVVAVAVFKRISEAQQQGIKDANAYKDAIRGLNSVAEESNISSEAMEAATAKVVDQFFNATAAATAFKNLILRGYSLDEATATIIRLKDAAAFGRQASLTLADAVKSATEGLKNENSILVDNAGVTKNVAKMWEEYSAVIGVSVANMTQQQKVQAEILGIQKETAAMTGDITKLQDSLSGKMAAATNQAYLFSKAYGEAMTPLQAAGTELKTGFLSVLTEIVETLPGVSAGATTTTAAFLGMMIVIPAVTKVIEIIKKLQIAMAAIKLSMGTVGLVAAGIGLLVAGYTALQSHIQKVREEQEREIQSHRDAVNVQASRTKAIKDMLAQYVELSRKQTISYTDALNLKAIELELSSQYGVTKQELDKLVQTTNDYATALQNVAAAATSAEIVAALEIQSEDSYKAAYSGMRALDEYLNYLQNAQESDLLNPNNAYLGRLKGEIDTALAGYMQWLTDRLALYSAKAQQQGMTFNEELSRVLIDTITPHVDPYDFGSLDEFNTFFENLSEKIGTLATNERWTSAEKTVRTATKKIMSGMVPTQDEIIAVTDAWDNMLGVDGPIYWYLEDLIDAGKLTETEVAAIMAALQSYIDPLGIIGNGLDATTKLMTEQAEAAKEAAWGLDQEAKALDNLASSVSNAADNYTKLKSNRDAYFAGLESNQADRAAIETWRQVSAQLATMERGTEEYRKAQAALMSAANELNLSYTGTDASRAQVSMEVEAKVEDLQASADALVEARLELIAAIDEIFALGPGVIPSEVMSSLISMRKELAASGDAVYDLQASLQGASDAYVEVTGKVNDYYKSLQDQENKSYAIIDYREQLADLQKLTAGTDAYNAKIAQLQALALELGIIFDGTAEDLGRTTRAVDQQAVSMASIAADLDQTRKELQAAVREYISDGTLTAAEIVDLNALYKALDSSESRAQALAAIGNFFDNFKDQFDTGLQDAKQAFTDSLDGLTGDWNDTLAEQLSTVFRYALSKVQFDDPTAGDAVAAQLVAIISGAVTNADTSGLFTTLTEFTAGIMEGVTPTEDQMREAFAAWSNVFGSDGYIYQWLSGLDVAPEVITAVQEALIGVYDPLALFGFGLDDSTAKANAAAAAYANLETELTGAALTIKNAKDSIVDLNQTLGSRKAFSNYLKLWDGLYKSFKDTEAAGSDTSAVIGEMNKMLRNMGVETVASSADIDKMNENMLRFFGMTEDGINSTLNELYALQDELFMVAASSNIDGEVYVNANQALGEIQGLINMANAALAVLQALGFASQGEVKSGGGGGGGKRASAYEKAIERLEHLKNLEQLTYEQELANLESLSRKYRLTGEERLDLEERIFDVKKRIAERDNDNLTDLIDAMTTALSERYAAMQESEIAALDQSRSAWEEWRDHNVAAIQDQIDALDALDQAEDRQATQDEHLRKIAQLEQNLAYEQNAYNQIQLQKQLDAAKEAYQKWLTQISREDQRAALEDQIDNINEKANTELAALDAQRAQIEAYYAKRMAQANLQAEAELALTQSTQQQIIDLLATYAPEYDAAGRSLGERFMSGFTSAVGAFDAWFDGLSASLAAALDQIQAANKATAAASGPQAYDENGNPVSGVVINQENNFNTPVETPAETERRIQRANEDLAVQLMRE